MPRAKLVDWDLTPCSWNQRDLVLRPEHLPSAQSRGQLHLAPRHRSRRHCVRTTHSQPRVPYSLRQTYLRCHFPLRVLRMFVATIPAIIWVDQLGRKPVLISGAFLMAACHFIVAILSGLFRDSWAQNKASGWAACALVWVFTIGACPLFPSLSRRLVRCDERRADFDLISSPRQYLGFGYSWGMLWYYSPLCCGGSPRYDADGVIICACRTVRLDSGR